jgi:hypothetical protein
MISYQLDSIFYFVGEIVVILGLFFLLSAIIGSILVIYSYKTGHFVAAGLMLVIVSVLESSIKSFLKLAKIDEDIVDDVGIHLRNYINRKKFLRVPKEERIIFIPQCLRSTKCPAKLTPEGIKCLNCGLCGIGEAKSYSEDLGYKFFVVPGSSFIKRIIKKYHPKAIVGVGCQMEIKEGIDMCHAIGLPAVGVPLLQSGCVATKVDWDMFRRTISECVEPVSSGEIRDQFTKRGDLI